MILKNLLRRRGRTLLTMLGVAIGVAAIVGLGMLADVLQSGYTSLLTGSEADLILSQPDAYDLTTSAVDEEAGEQLLAMPEVEAVSGMVQGLVQSEDQPYFFVFGYPEDSFALERFQVTEGTGLYSREAGKPHGRPALLGSAAAEAMHKSLGDTLRVNDSAFRIIGIYQTGNALEDGSALLRLRDAQDLLGQARKVSLFYIQLKEPGLRARVEERAERLWPNLLITTSGDLAGQQSMVESMRGVMLAIAMLAVVIGGVGLANAQLMAVFERTREIGVLRAVGWRRGQVLGMILGESVAVCTLGGLLGVGLGWLAAGAIAGAMGLFGGSGTLQPETLAQAAVVVLGLGLAGGLYPAWRAACLPPIEALRYEGGNLGSGGRLPIGGMAIQGLWRRRARTLLTLGGLALTVGAVMALDGVTRGFIGMATDLASGLDTEVVVREADVSDIAYSAIDERVTDKISALPAVKNASGVIFTAAVLPDAGLFMLQGYAPGEYGIRHFRIVEGERLTGNRQVMLGRQMAVALKKGVGDTLSLGGMRFRVVGIYETKVAWEATGGVISLRDAMAFVGRPRKVGVIGIKLHDASQASAVVAQINSQFPDVHATLSGDFASQMPDLQNMSGIINAVSAMAVAVGSLGVMNTMLMSVLERTREIGVLRALGWRRRSVLWLILREALVLGALGGVAGIGMAFAMGAGLARAPMMGSLLTPAWSWDGLARALAVALFLGVLGGLYPAYRATRLQPVEALRYE
jgi:ABC-type antimicrobial peptide transport system permease subunit